MKIATGIPSVFLALLLTTGAVSNAQNKQPAAAQKPSVPILRLDAGGPVSEVTSLVFSPDGKTLYAAGYDKAVYAWTRDAQGEYQFAPKKMLRIPIGPGVNDGLIKTMAISSDGKYLAVAGVAMGSHVAGFSEGGLMWPASTQSVEQRKETGTIYVFDLEAQRDTKIIRLQDHVGPITLLAFAPQPKQPGQPHVLVSAADEYDNDARKQKGGLRVWHVEQPEKPIAKRVDLTAPSEKNTLPRGIAAVRSGNAANAVHVGIAWGEDELRIWDIANDQIFDLGNLRSYAVAGLQNRILLATGYRRGNDGVDGWHLSKWQTPVNANTKPADMARPMLDNHAPVGLAAAGNADLALVVSYLPKVVNGANKGDIGFYLLDANNLKRLPNDNAAAVKFSDSDHRYAYAISPNGDFIAVAGNLTSKIQVFKVNGDKSVAELKPLDGQGDLFRRVRFFAKGDLLGLGLNAAAQTNDNKDADAELIFDLKQSQTVDADGWKEVSGGDKADFTVEGASVDGRHQLVATLAGGKKTTITLPDKQYVRQYARCPKTENHPPLIAAVIWSPNFAETILRVYNAETGERLRQFSGHTDQITSIAFSPDGKLLASAGMDRTVRVWWMEDLKDHIGTVGFLDFLQLSDNEDGKATVKAIDEKAARNDIKDALKEGDLVTGFTPQPNGKLQETKQSKDFFYYLAAMTPGQKVRLRVERNGRNLVPDPEVEVQQAVDERKPLFTLFFKKNQKKWSWIGWTPTGPFESSDQTIEKLVGWHFNPPKRNPDAPSRFADISEYRKQNFKSKLIQSLAETGAPPPPPLPEGDKIGEAGNRTDKVPEEEQPPVEPPKTIELPPEPVLALFVKERHENAEEGYFHLPPDRRQRVWAKTPNLQAVFTVTEYFPLALDQGLVWELDGQTVKLNVARPEPGIFEADLSGYAWKEKPDDKPYLLRVSFKDRPDYYREQAIVFDPDPPPAPEPMKELPNLSIASPGPLTVLYDEINQKEIEVTIGLSKAKDNAPVQPGTLSFERNGAPLLQNGQPITRPFQAGTKEIKVTLPVENGANRIRGILTASEGDQTRLSEDIVVYYRRPPRVSDLDATPDKQKPRATVTCKIRTPVDLPLTEVLLLVNSKMFMLPDSLIDRKQDPNNKEIWNITINNVLLIEGENTIRVIPRNKDGKVIATPKKVVTWQKPPMDPTPRPRPKVLYVNVNDQAPLTDFWLGDEFHVQFNVLSPVALQRVLVYYNGKRLNEPKIPEPVNGMKYSFEVPVVLSELQNDFRVIAQDIDGSWSERLVPLITLQAPVRMVVDQIVVEDPPRTKLPAIVDRAGSAPVEFGTAAAVPRVILQGRVITADSTKKFREPYVKCWVNGYMQTGTLYQSDDKPTEWEFAMRLVLNEHKNKLCLEMPEAPESRASQKECILECAHPETKQKLHLVLVGHNPNNVSAMDMEALEKRARKAFGINGQNLTPANNPVKIHRVAFHRARTAQITRLLQEIQIMNPTKSQGDHQLVVFYYQGTESDKQDQIVLSTLDRSEGKSAFTAKFLKDRLEDIHGAHVVMLDVAQPKPVENEWETGRFLGMLRSAHTGAMPEGSSLTAALEDSLKQTRKLGELPGMIQQIFQRKGVGATVKGNPSKEIEDVELP